MRAVFLGLIASILAGCGGYQTRDVGIEESTLLILRGENLVGLTVELNSNFSKTISKSDLTTYEMGVAGAANKEAEDLDTVTLMVESGLQRIVVSKKDVVLVKRDLHFANGQTRELRIR